MLMKISLSNLEGEGGKNVHWKFVQVIRYDITKSENIFFTENDN